MCSRRSGNALNFESNAHLQEAYQASLVANVLPAEMMKNSYLVLQRLFSRDNSPKSPTARSGWTTSTDGFRTSCATAANCGCVPSDHACCTSRRATAALVSAVTILRSVITRSDVIIKAPSNDPLTASPLPGRWPT